MAVYFPRHIGNQTVPSTPAIIFYDIFFFLNVCPPCHPNLGIKDNELLKYLKCFVNLRLLWPNILNLNQ